MLSFPALRSRDAEKIRPEIPKDAGVVHPRSTHTAPRKKSSMNGSEKAGKIIELHGKCPVAMCDYRRFINVNIGIYYGKKGINKKLCVILANFR